MAAKGTFEGLRNDLTRVCEEHDFIVKSLTFTRSMSGRTHGSLNFDTEGGSQKELPLDGEAGSTEKA